MPKRKRLPNGDSEVEHLKPSPPRKSARLQAKAQPTIKDATTIKDVEAIGSVAAHLPSPADTIYTRTTSKRKPEFEHSAAHELNIKHKRRKSDHNITCHPTLDKAEFAPIQHWVLHNIWPSDYVTRGRGMDSKLSSKRKSASAHTSVILARMAQHNVYMNDPFGDRDIGQSSRILCEKLKKGSRAPPGLLYPLEHRDKIARAMAGEQEALIQAFITPLVIPSITSLRSFGTLPVEGFGDEMNALWTRAATMGSTQPKPDYVAGLRMQSFDPSTWDKLENYATPKTPVLLSPVICFPVLIGEVKSPRIGLHVAEEQALHAAAIAIKSQFSLFWEVYGKYHATTEELYGQALVFSMCHNNSRVNVAAYYALPKQKDDEPENKRRKLRQKEKETEEDIDVELEIFSYAFASWGLLGAEKNKPHNFVETLHRDFSPKHLKRIRDAAKLLPAPAPKTNLSFATAKISVDSNSQANQEQMNHEEGSNALLQELSALREAFAEQKQESEKREEGSNALMQELSALRGAFAEQKQEGEKREQRLEARIDQLMELLATKNSS